MSGHQAYSSCLHGLVWINYLTLNYSVRHFLWVKDILTLSFIMCQLVCWKKQLINHMPIRTTLTNQDYSNQSSSLSEFCCFTCMVSRCDAQEDPCLIPGHLCVQMIAWSSDSMNFDFIFLVWLVGGCIWLFLCASDVLFLYITVCCIWLFTGIYVSY